jgi:hypothetical protein
MSLRRDWSLVRFELAGTVFMVVAGSALHFAFDWAGGWRPLAIIAAANESVWEHLKLAFWPGACWAMFAPVPDGLRRTGIIAAKALTLLVTASLIVVIFTSYTAVLGRNLLPLDIGTFVLAILIGQMLSTLLLSRGALSGSAIPRAGLAIFCAQLVGYGLLTFYPPDHWLFIEASSGVRGIPVR